MITLFLLIISAVLILAVAFTPYITRKTELFGVSLPSEHINDPELLRLKALYRNQLLVLGLLPTAASLVVGLWGDWSSPGPIVVWTVVLFVYLLLSFLLYLPRHQQMKRIKAERAWAETTEPAVVASSTVPAGKDFISSAWLLLFVPIIALGLGAIALIWPQVPDPMPIHYALDGTVDGTAPKSLMALAPMLLTEVFLAVVLAGVFLLMRRARRQIDAAKPEESLEQDRRFRRISSILIVTLGIIMLLFMEVLQVLTMLGRGNSELIFVLVIGMMFIIGVGLWYLMFKVGQGGTRLKERTARPSGQANYDDDRFWKLGLFYVNPQDPAWVVEKRFGVGWTVNYARPATWLALATLVVLVVGLLVGTFLLVGK